MAYIWQTDINGQIELHPDAVRLVPELKGLPDKVLKYIILVQDYRKSPIKDFPDEQRKSLAFLNILATESEKKKLLTNPTILKAMVAFEGLVYCERRQLKRIYQARLELAKAEIRKPTLAFKEIKEQKEIIEFFRKEVETIDKELSVEGYDDDNVETKGKRELSYIERWQRRIKKFNKMSDV